jgi:roadblock/LC7 domain-containing protein
MRQSMTCLRSCSLALILASLAVAADRRPIADTDLYSFQWIASPRISPDGSRVVFTHVTVNKKHDGYETALWIVSTTAGAARQLTGGPRDSAPQWSPDGKLLAFVRAVEKDGKPQPAQIYLLAMEGGEARALTDLPKGAAGPVWSPDGRAIAFSSTNIQRCSRDHSRGLSLQRRGLSGARSAHAHLDRRSTQDPRGNAEGQAGHHRRIQRVRYRLVARRLEDLLHVEPRARALLRAAARRDLRRQIAAGGDIAKIAGIDGSIHAISLSPDGSHIAFVGSINPRRGRAAALLQPAGSVHHFHGAGRGSRNLTANYDYDIGGGVGGDQAPPRGSAVLRSPTGAPTAAASSSIPPKRAAPTSSASTPKPAKWNRSPAAIKTSFL